MFLSPGVIATLLFTLFVLVVSMAVSHMLFRGVREREKSYSFFPDQISQFLFFMSDDGMLVDALPKVTQDSLFEQMCVKKKFKDVISPAEYARFEEYMKGAVSYPDIPFVFSFRGESGVSWYELRAKFKKSMSNVAWCFLIKNVTSEVDSRSKWDLLQDNMDMLLSNTGDFLWSFDVDSRQFNLLTPISDEEGRVVPRSVGVQDIHALLPDEEYATFEKRVNARVMAYRSGVKDASENDGIKMRLVGPEGRLVWYSFRYRIYLEENSRLVIKGIARHMDMLFDTPMFENNVEMDVALSTMLSFPDIRIFCVDRENRLVSCNQAFALDFRYVSPKSIFGKRLLEVVRPKYYSFIQGNLSEVFESGRSRTWKGPFNRDHRLLWFNAVPLTRKDGFVYRVLGVYIQMDENDFKENL